MEYTLYPNQFEKKKNEEKASIINNANNNISAKKNEIAKKHEAEFKPKLRERVRRAYFEKHKKGDYAEYLETLAFYEYGKVVIYSAVVGLILGAIVGLFSGIVLPFIETDSKFLNWLINV